MNANDKGGFDWVWYLYISISAIAGFINLKRAVTKQPDLDEVKQLKIIIDEKDKIIATLEKRIIQYQHILEYDNENKSNRGDKLE